MLTDDSRDEPYLPRHVLAIFASTLLLAMLFPLAPLWGFGIRMAAMLMVWHFRGQICAATGMAGRVYLTTMLSLTAMVSLSVMNELTSGLSWVMDRVLLIHGLDIPLTGSLFISLFDGGLIVGVAWIAWQFYRRERTVELWRRVAIMSAVLFAAWGLLSTGTSHWSASPAAFVKNLNWQRLWMEWALCFLLAACIVRSEQKRLFLKMVVAAGALNAAIIIGQHLFSDFSYVLESVQSFDVYFMRSRGNSYYHGAAMHLLLLPLFAVLILNSDGRRHWSLWTTGLLIAIALYINGTRATALAATMGMSFFLLVYIPWWRAPLRPIGFAVVALCAFGTMIDYTKPTIEGLAGESALAKSNSGRIGLMISGLRHLRTAPIFGQGAGNISIPVEQALGDSTTYSSHCLYVDSFLAGGIVAGTCLLLWFVVPTLFFISDRLFGPNCDRPDQLPAAIVGLFAAFGVSCLFFSIERADTIALFAAFLGVVFPRAQAATVLETQSDAATVQFAGQRRLIWLAVAIAAIALPFTLPMNSILGIVVGIVVVISAPFVLATSEKIIGWLPRQRALQIFALLLVIAAPTGAVLTSSCYLWPAIEFAWRHRQDSIWIGNDDKELYTNSPALAQTTQWVSSLLGDRDMKIQILKDDPQQLPQNANILWNPVNDRDYPRLIKHFGYNITPPSVRAPGFRLPRNWSVIHSKQMTISFLNVGPLVSPAIRLADIGRVTVNGKSIRDSSDGRPQFASNNLQFRFTPTHALRLSGGQFSCQFESEPVAGIGGQEPFSLRGDVVTADGKRTPLKAEGTVQAGWQQLLFPLPNGEIHSVELTLIGGKSTRFRALSPEFYGDVLPDVAAHAVDVRDGADRDASTLIDDNLTTAHRFPNGEPASFTFDFSHDPTAISLYRISRAKTLGAEEFERLSWRLQGSDDAKTWHLLDSRHNVPISDEYKSFHSFTVAHPRKFRLYRLHFPAETSGASRSISLTEVELLPMVDPQQRQKTHRDERLAKPRSKRGIH